MLSYLSMRYLVTGGAGFIGSHLVDALIKKNHQVCVLDDLSSGKKENLNPKAKFYQLNILDDLSLVFKDFKPEIIYHLAAQSSVAVSLRDPAKDAQINILGSLSLFKYCRQNINHFILEQNKGEESRGFTVRKVIFVSSGGTIYGTAKKIPTPETEPTNPECPYAVAKLSVEKYLSALKIPHSILRLANVYGPRQDPQGEAGVVAIFIGKILKNEPPTIFGTGKQTRDYVYIDDVVHALLLAATKKTPALLNIGTGKETSVKQILKLIDSKVKSVFTPARSGELQRSSIDSRQARRILGWQPKVSLEQGIKITKEYFKKSI